MEIEDCVALVTGANRGLGKAYADALLASGAAKVYAGARDPATIVDPRVTPIALDVTREEDVAAAAGACADVNLLINNAGIMQSRSMLAPDGEAALRAEFEVNVFGVLRMVRAFAPILAANGGGAVANVLSVVSWFVSPFAATYSASKHAALALTEGVRMELRRQGTLVVGVYAGFIDTEMAAGIAGPKSSPQTVAEETLAGIRDGAESVLVGDRAYEVWSAVRADPAALHARMQQVFDSART